MSQIDFNCNKCQERDTDDMVQCDTCDKWYHYDASSVSTQTGPHYSATEQLTANLRVSPANIIRGPISDVPGPSLWEKAHQPSKLIKDGYEKSHPKLVSGNVLQKNVTIGDTLTPRNCHSLYGKGTSSRSLPSPTQLKLQMLEEEKELQRQYLEKIIPTAAQIAARHVLPKELPYFDGNPEDWPIFISNYKNSTEIAGYTDGENLMRLQSCLWGRAKELSFKILDTSTRKENQQFEVSLPWKEDVPQLPDSYEVAYHRLQCLQKQFKRNPQLQQVMQTEINKLISKGYARKVLDSEMFSYTGRTWYLPIFVALHPNKPGKVRLVWDAAAKSQNKSLNDFLICGPDLLTPLLKILIEFRVRQIAICGDIAEMFHRINVKDDDMHAQRFLWFENVDDKLQPCVYVMKALTFGMSCAPCIAHFIRNKNAENFKSVYPRAVKAIQQYHYMDDFIDSVDSEEEAKKLALQVKAIHSEGGFHMRNWVTNSEFVRSHLSAKGSDTQTSFKSIEKVLGMYWESKNDNFQYNYRFSRLRRDVFNPDVFLTKREVLQVLMSIFDPLEFVAHYTIGLKILLQDIWRSGIKWDENLTKRSM
ncbi:hypothetical protein EVAR_65812_1 [Eumeta japonica]|uniref:PHD-type domain-containing protein n=1 Tax=Eumeta variegata TaxID=151549 RepID=A0A4C1TFF7_EUMVA|nr:hypothetical protein EVAR_65812_1 [Eumeta japonica]